MRVLVSVAVTLALCWTALLSGCSQSSTHLGCVDDEECGAHMLCEGGVCVSALPDCDGGALCGDICCSAGQRCVSGECIAGCGEGVACGPEGYCCPPGDVCLDDTCCDEDKACGDACCGFDEICEEGLCSSCTTALCGSECCESGEVCLPDGCCDGDRTCGTDATLCCGAGEECIEDVCVSACDGIRCGGLCCAAGEVCTEGECQLACETALCGAEEVCCERGEVCVGGATGMCCSATRACGDTCCGEGTFCDDSGGCVACDRPLCGDECCDTELGELCYAGACCTEDRVCASACCAEGSICEGETCHLDCGESSRCTADDGSELCCTGAEVCFMGECIVADVDCIFDGDCGLDEYCDEILDACLPIPDSDCEYFPPVGEFTPVVEWHWSTSAAHRQIMMTPAVANLTDDNGDGVVDLSDIPDVVVIAFSGSNYHTDGVMYVLSGDDGHLHYTVTESRFRPGGSVALGDVDGDTVPDIVACGSTGGLVVLNNDGTVKWTIPSGCADIYAHPAIADLDGDGTVEIVTDYRVFADGAEVCRGYDDAHRIQSISDVDGDGRLDVVGGSRAFAFDPTAATPCAEIWSNSAVSNGRTAIADMDLDGDPDVVVVAGNLWILEGSTGEIIWGPYPIPGGGGGGAPTVADFDGDGRPETATAGLDYYAVYDLDCVAGGDPAYCASGRTDGLLWTQATHDHSSSQTGSSVFDFEGDGAAEVVYADEWNLRIYRGSDGAILYSIPNSSGTLFEYPLIVDVDNDAQAEIVVIANDYAFPVTRGVRVIGDSLHNWVRTRRIWNQHTYHVTNIEEDGTVPTSEVPNWTVDGFNNFRQNTQTFGVHNAPNMIPESFFVDDRHCPEHYRLGVHVMNRGSRSIPAGLMVGFYEGDPTGAHTLVGSVSIERPILSGGGEYVSIEWDVPIELQDAGRVFYFYVVVDDTTLGDEVAIHECIEDDNRSEVITMSCEVL